MKRLSWKYVAGLIDGEGCLDVQILKKSYITPRVRVELAEAGYHLLLMLQNSYGGNIYKRESKNPNWSDSYSWELNGYKKVCPFLRNIKNHLYIKHEQARFILWMENNLKGKHLNDEVRKYARNELKLQKRDPHRLSERAEEEISLML